MTTTAAPARHEAQDAHGRRWVITDNGQTAPNGRPVPLGRRFWAMVHGPLGGGVVGFYAPTLDAAVAKVREVAA